MMLLALLGALALWPFASADPGGNGTVAIPEIPSQSIYGGTEVKDARFPQLILFQNARSGNFICGGSFLGDYYVLTAAHCVANLMFPDYYDNIRVHAGIWSYFMIGGPSNQRSRIVHIDVHPLYHNSGKSSRNDIAVITLEDNFVLNTHVQKTVIYRDDVYDTSVENTVTIVGAGSTNYVLPMFSKTVHYAKTTIYDHALCEKRYKGLLGDDCSSGTCVPRISVDKICTSAEGHGTYHGDSGGPVLFRRKDYFPVQNHDIQIGVIGQGRPPEYRYQESIPDVHTNAGLYCDFIERNARGFKCSTLDNQLNIRGKPSS